MKLITPSFELEAEFSAFYHDLLLNDNENAEYYQDSAVDFDHYVQRLIDESLGLNLREGYVPCSHFWLVDESQTIIGIVRVRHNIDTDFLAREAGHIGYCVAPAFRRKGLGTLMLKLALLEAQKLGIQSALLTANEFNIGSRRVIEANGGKFNKVIQGEVIRAPIVRYWISL
ncbi:GNAT family N-acetyltransferase [Vibrio sp. TRT 21S02]|uniref:GNAT family N-acetyltransferase n=1 Tax=Vibrio sp. TRT 21S02 TaxID=3418507 RepID=UPI003CF530F3